MIFAQGSYMEIQEKRCLNLMHHGVECSHCIGHCPAQAIIHDNDHIYLVKEKCQGCGLCFSNCPTQVFRSEQWDETAIIRDIEDKGWSITEFFCDRHTLPYKIDKTKERGAVQLPACLSIVSRGGWYELGLNTEVEIHLDQCRGCPLSGAVERLQYNVGIAAEWLEAGGHTPSFSYIHEGLPGKSKKRLLAIETGLKVTSRRDLFISLIQKGQEIANRASGRTNSFPEEVDRIRPNRSLPEWQTRMREVFTGHAKDSSNPAYWPAISINHHCVNCGMCSHFCPSGALQITVKEGVCHHYFTSGLCLDCRICQLFCPREAIRRDRKKVEKPFDMIRVYSTSGNQCRRCGNITMGIDEPLCYLCREDDHNEDELKNSLKKLL